MNTGGHLTRDTMEELSGIRWRRLTLIYMDHLMDVAIVMMAVPTYQPEVVLQHLKWDHGCISHTTEAAFLGTYEKYTQRKKMAFAC